MKKYAQFKQGVYKPLNRAKCTNSGNIIYRSFLERKFMIWCDKNANVIEWGSENVIVPYVSPIDNAVHRYIVDMYVKVRERDKICKYLIEIKPYKQTIQPTITKKKKESTIIHEHATWVVNNAKWEAAKGFANKYGMKFIIITDKDLDNTCK
jgi:hypothetical protein